MKKLILLLSLFIAVNTTAQNIPCYVRPEGLIAWYPFSGNAVDSSGNGHDGTVSGALLTSDRSGNPASAYLFDGVSTRISTSMLPPLGNAARTITSWFKYNSIPDPCGDKGICIAGYGGNTRYCTQACRNFSLEVTNYDGPPVASVDGICIATKQAMDSVDNSWHFFAAVYDTSFGDFQNIKLYIDGVYQTTSTYIGSGTSEVQTDTFSRFEIGKGHYECERFFDGIIDDIGVWNRALSESELFDLYKGVPTALADSFLTYVSTQCTATQFTVSPKRYTSNLSIRTFFGDGTSQTDTFSASSEFARYNHAYVSTGTYLVKQVLYLGATPTDSVSFNLNYTECHVLHIGLYNDANANCIYDNAEGYINEPSLIAVDSNGITIDSISATSSFDYYAYAETGSVYNFRPVATSPGLNVICPATGVISDTISAALSDTIKYFGLACSSTPGYDLQIFTSFRAGPHHFGGTIIANNTYCTPPAAILTMQLSPQYNSSLSFVPAPSSIVGNSVSWNINTLSSASASPFLIYANMEGSGAFGDTVVTSYTITPVSGDANPADNIVIRTDTVKSGYDPNDINVSPAGCLPLGVTNLTYTIHFENTGNDTAYDIYILDTLSSYLDASTLRIKAASAAMNVYTTHTGGHTIVKFAFPGINLLDSSHHAQCDGMVVYSINTLNITTNSTLIPNRAGIYFDNNPVVLTNTINNMVGCPLSVSNTIKKANTYIYPNPFSDELTIKIDDDHYDVCTITNTIGNVVYSHKIDGDEVKADLKYLPGGIYYVTLRGASGVKSEKVIKY